MSLKEDVQGSIKTGWLLGPDPSKEDIREEVQRLKDQGKTGQEIGKQIGVYYMSKGDTETLDLLEDVLTEEFEDYGGDA